MTIKKLFWLKLLDIQQINKHVFQKQLSEHLAEKFGDNSKCLKLLILFLAIKTQSGSLRVSKNLKFDEIIETVFENECLLEDINTINNLIQNLNDVLLNNPKIFGLKGEFKPIIEYNNYLYFQKFLSFESELINLIQTKIDNSISLIDSKLKIEVKKLISDHCLVLNNFELNEKQMQAIDLFLDTNFIIITGGPGTGKTTIVLNVIRSFLYLNTLLNSKSNPKIIIAAPTGKAAKRLFESLQNSFAPKNMDYRSDIQKLVDSLIPNSAFTIHKLLDLNKNTSDFSTKLIADLIIIDEASMVDVEIFKYLLESIPINCKLVLLGDKNQLPPVESGTVFNDLIPGLNNSSHKLFNNYVELTESNRFGPEIQELSNCMQNNDINNFRKLFYEQKNSIQFTDTKNIFETIKHFLKPIIELHAEFRNTFKLNDELLNKTFKVLCNNKILCATNDMLEIVNNTCKKILKFEYQDIYSLMPIMIKKNDYQNNLFNGDFGVIFKNDNKEYKAFFKTQNGLNEFYLSKLSNYELNYSQTIHKSQGSEYDNVLIIMPDEYSPMLTKELLYTGITRSKNQVIIASELDILIKTISKSINRDSGLKEYLNNSN